MKLSIDEREIFAKPQMTLLDMVNELGLDSDRLTEKPLAAKIAGEVFNLNYIPQRDKDISGERPSMRRAMAASKGVVKLLRYRDPAGKDVYTRTSQFVMFLALHQLWPHARGKMNCKVGKALYIEVTGAEDFCVSKLKAQIEKIVEQDIPLIRRSMTTADAMAQFQKNGQPDKARLLSWRQDATFSMYSYGDYSDYFYGELAPSTGCLVTWDILPADGGFMFLYPEDDDPEQVSRYMDLPKYLQVSLEGERWCKLMECENVADLNELVCSGKIRELIRVNEALHEKRYSQVADRICEQGAKVVMLAGPSSSGKTTSANRLATQLRVHGMKPVLMSLDDYYVDRETILPGPDGQIDFEHINTIDADLFRSHLKLLLAGNKVELPVFDFIEGKRKWIGNKLQLSSRSVIIVEGLHALNPVLLPDGIRGADVFKLYVSPLLPLNLDDHNRIPTSLLRLLRRTVRDYETRGASVQKTMSMWGSVRQGEVRWIFPFQEKADAIFNSSTLYELAVLKKHIYPLLVAIQPEESCYEQVRALVKILNYVKEADVDDEIPPTSLVREFIGGNAFYK